MLSGCSSWDTIHDEESRQVVRDLMDNSHLKTSAVRGYIFDSELDAIIKETLQGKLEVSPETQKYDVVATSHSRCIHLTNDIYRELMRKRDEERKVKESENKV